MDLEKGPDGIQESGKAIVPTSRYNQTTRDVETTDNTIGQSRLGQTYGMAAEDEPIHPPRHARSIHSLRHKQSQSSLQSNTYSYMGQPVPPLPDQADQADVADVGNDEGSIEEELAWGPSHPCFPHMNPHVALDSPEYQSSRIIRIRRDWMVKGDLAPTYSNLYPEILDPSMSEDEFRFVVQHINKTLVHAFDPYSTWNWIDGLLGLATGWLWEDFRPGGIKGKLRDLENWIEEWNHKVGAREGVRVIPLRRTGYMNIDIQIPDPQVMVLEDDASRRGSQDGAK